MADNQDDLGISGNEEKFLSDSNAAADSGFVPNEAPSDTLPPFANDENKKLDASIRDKETELERLKGELREHTERVAVMQEHLKNVQQEISHTQTLVEAKEKDYETEAHLGSLAQREGGRMRADVSSLEKQIQSVQDALNGLQASSFKASAQLDAFRETMQWNQEELLQWSLAAKQKDEDQEALQRYMKEDSAKIKALSMRLEKATEELTRAKAQLQTEVTETQAAQIELDKTAEQYRQLHLERQQVIRQWDEAKQAMHRRDAAIAKAGEHLLELTNRVRQLEEDAKAANKFLAQEQGRNGQVEQNIGLAERVAGLKRMELYAASQGMTEFEDEVLAMRNEARKAAAERSAAERENLRLEQEKKERESQLSELEKQADQTQEQLDTLYEKTDDLEKRTKQVDALHKQHEQRLGDVEKELQNLKSSMFKHSHQLFTLRKLESQLITQISSLQGTSRNLQARIHELDQRSLKQQENLYHVEFQVQQLERKVAYAGGKRSIEETNALNARIEELNKQLEGHTQQFSMLSTQVKRLTDELRASQRKFSSLNTEISQLSEKISQMELENDSAQSELGGATKQKEALLVHHDTLKLEIRHLRDTLNSASERVQQLQQRKLDLQLSMAEREKEIEAHMEIQRAELKVAEDARHQVAVDLRERQTRVDKLKQKYAIVAAKLAVPEAALEGMQSMGSAEDGAVPRSQAYFVIAAAQEREELQRTGDQLNAEILKAEKEIRMLARSLRVLNDRNTITRDSLRAADSSSDSVVEKTQLEQQYRQMNETVARKRMLAQEHAGELEQRQAQILQLHKGLSLLQDEVKRLDSDYQQAQSLVLQQEQALGRAIKKMQEVRSKLGPDAPFVDSNTDLSDASLPLPEAHIALMEQRQRNSTLLTLLQTVAVANPQLEAAISAALEQAGLQFSSRPSTADSNLSAASSVSVPRGKSERKSPTANFESVSPRTPNSGSPTASRKNSARSLINAVNLTLDSVLPPVGGLPATPDTKGSRATSTASTPKRLPTPPRTAPRSESKRSMNGVKPPSSPPSEQGSRPSSRGSLLSVNSRKLELSPSS